MQAYAEGFEIMKTSPYGLDLHKIAGIWGYGSVVRSWLLELLEDALAKDPELEVDQGLRRGLRRGPLDRAGRDRPGRPRAGHHAQLAGALPLASGGVVRREDPRGSPQRVRRSRREEVLVGRVLRQRPAEVLDDERQPLSHRARDRARPGAVRLRDLRRLGRPRRGASSSPRSTTSRVSRLLPPGMSIVGFALTEMSEDEFRRSMHDAVAEFSRRKPIDETVWQDFASRLHYVSGKFEDPASFAEAADASSRSSIAPTAPAATASTTSPSRRAPSDVVNDNLAKAGLVHDPDDPTPLLAHHHREAVRPRPRERRRAQRRASPRASTSDRSSASTTTSARRRCRTSSRCASATPSSSRIWNRNYIDHVADHASPRTSASRAAASSTRRPGRCATSSRTTCCSSSWSWRWSRRWPSRPTRCATRRSRCCAR